MQGQEYLNQISAASRPVKQSKVSKFLSSKILIGGAIFLVLLVAIMIVGGVLSGNKSGDKNNCYKLYLHLTNTASVVDEYKDNIKSSTLRGSAASLKGVLSNTYGELEAYLVAKYSFKAKDIDKDITEEATLEKDGLSAELFEAKINGTLDRTFAHKMAYEIDLIAAEEAKIIKSTSNDDLKELLTTSYESLSTLYDNFNNFSETNN